MKNRLSKNFIWNTIGSTLNALSSLVILIIITRMNGLNNAGIFSLTFAVASILFVIAIYAGRNFYITDIKNTFSEKEYIFSRIITCDIGMIILIFYILYKKYDFFQNYILISLCVWKFLEAFSDIIYAILQKKDLLYKAGISLTIKTIVSWITFIVTNLITHNLMIAVSFLWIMPLFIMLLYDIPQMAKLVNFKEKININVILKIYLKEFFVFANTLLIMYILNIPKFAIERYLSNDIQAIFAIILMPASIIPLFSQFITAPIVNKLTHAFGENDLKKMKYIGNKVIRLIFLFGLFATIIGYLIGIPVLNYIYNQDLNAYRTQFLIVLVSYIFYGMSYIRIMELTIFRKLREQFWIHLILTIVMTVISFLLIKFKGITGASTSYFIIMILYYLSLEMMQRYNYILKGKNK